LQKLLAKAFLQTDLQKDAFAAAEELASILPSRPENVLWAARFMNELGKFAEAEHRYLEIIDAFENNEKSYWNWRKRNVNLERFQISETYPESAFDCKGARFRHINPVCSDC